MFAVVLRILFAVCMAGILDLPTHQSAAAAPLPEELVFSERFDSPLTRHWEQLKFGKPTDYFLCMDGTNQCLKAVADKTCSAFMTKVRVKPQHRLVARWRWKIDHVPQNASDNVSRTFDHTARIIIAFDTLIGPPRTINYVWANQEKIGTDMRHPLSGRAKMVVVQSGNLLAEKWIPEERDVTSDWHRLFGEKAMPDIVALGVITDSENTGTQVTAYYQNLELLER